MTAVEMWSENSTELWNDDEIEISEEQTYVIVFFTFSSGLLGIVANTITIAAILHGKLWKNSGFVCILNLLLCNLIHCSIFLPLVTLQAFTGLWTDNPALCNAVAFGLFCNLGTELLGYTCISLNRYFCIVDHKWYTILYTKAWRLTVQWIITWSVYPVILSLPLFGIWSHYEYEPKKLLCHPFLGQNCTGYCLFVFIFAIVTTVPVICCCYLWIIVTYVKVKRHAFQNQDSGRSDIIMNTTNAHHDHSRHKAEHKMAFTILAAILFFAVFRVPFIILYIYDPSMSKVNPLVHTSLIYAGTILNWVNPIIYALTNNQLRNSLNKMLSCK